MNTKITMLNRKGDFLLFLTICTPTYNRAYTLERVYNSLLGQRDADFEWIIVDDGSNDNTEELVKSFIDQEKLRIKYIFQSNQGKHIALNKGIDMARGELFTCLDSDDWLYPNSIELIKVTWEKNSQFRNLVGLISLDSYENGDIVGTRFPEHLTQANWIDLNFNYNISGDKDYYFRTDVLKEHKFPSYTNNKHMPPSYQYYLLSKKYDFLLINSPTKFVEYLNDGISKNKYNKYVVAPDNFAKYRYEIMDLIPSTKRKIINAIHFNSSLYLGNLRLKPQKTSNKIVVFFTKPLGLLLSIYIKIKVNKNNNVAHKIKNKSKL